jgi:hypothetical protein
MLQRSNQPQDAWELETQRLNQALNGLVGLIVRSNKPSSLPKPPLPTPPVTKREALAMEADRIGNLLVGLQPLREQPRQRDPFRPRYIIAEVPAEEPPQIVPEPETRQDDATMSASPETWDVEDPIDFGDVPIIDSQPSIAEEVHEFETELNDQGSMTEELDDDLRSFAQQVKQTRAEQQAEMAELFQGRNPFGPEPEDDDEDEEQEFAADASDLFATRTITSENAQEPSEPPGDLGELMNFAMPEAVQAEAEDVMGSAMESFRDDFGELFSFPTQQYPAEEHADADSAEEGDDLLASSLESFRNDFGELFDFSSVPIPKSQEANDESRFEASTSEENLWTGFGEVGEDEMLRQEEKEKSEDLLASESSSARMNSDDLIASFSAMANSEWLAGFGSDEDKPSEYEPPPQEGESWADPNKRTRPVPRLKLEPAAEDTTQTKVSEKAGAAGKAKTKEELSGRGNMDEILGSFQWE